ncbi:nucleotidyltransferase family protein [Bremerella sp. P1]|uniref:nucleotidyltransferase family protein n=1 Tax=Bremerella sp. P1 TaxID=3026424 RepID=UPI0023687D9E|nr:nucleotidyltransferase family protein [Bremerella sp. P1]WDI42180.1 nucleotidyltransferase family protein [Bremerella sp. P1]
MESEEIIKEWISSDPIRMRALRLASELNLSDWCIAAGFVGNLVWDKLHKKETSTPLNDFDLIYFDPQNIASMNDRQLELRLKNLTNQPWSVKNQARMHIRNKDRPYTSTSNAMSYWVEIETAVGVKLSETGEIELVAPFGIENLFRNTITINRKRIKPADFYKRIESKNWLTQWPKLKVIA